MKIMRKLVTQGLRLNKKRTIVTIIGIVLAVALLSALSTLVFSFRGSLISYQRQKDGNYHVAFGEITHEDIATLEKNRRVENMYVISELGYSYLEGSKNEYKPYACILATDKNGMENGGFELLEGRFPENESEIVLPKHVQTNARLEYQVGDAITFEVGERVDGDGVTLGQTYPFDPNGSETVINTTSKTYTIVGFMKRPSYKMEDYTAPGYTFLTYQQEPADDVIMSKAYVRFTGKALTNYIDYVADIVGVDRVSMNVFYSDESMVDHYSEEELKEMLDELEKAKYYPDINIWLIRYERLWPIDSTFKVIFFLGGFVAVIILLTSIYCIKNSFEISVTEKIHLYGMIAGIGATKKQIRKSVFTEAAILGAIGIPIGLVSGLFASWVLIIISNALLQNIMTTQLIYIPSWIGVLIALVLGIVTVYLSAWKSARKAGRVAPIEAIRNQNEIKLNAKKLKTPRYISKLWGIGGVISYKNIKRNKKKYRTTVVSITICTITFIVISYFISLGYSLVSMAVSEEPVNVYFTVNEDLDNQLMQEDTEKMANVETFAIAKEMTVYFSEYDFSEKYGEYYKENVSSIYSDKEYVTLVVLDDATYAEYAKAAGVSNETGGVILYNRVVITGVGEVEEYAFKSNEITFNYDYESAVEFDENDNVIAESVHTITTSGKLSGVTEELPVGYKNLGRAALFTSQSTYEGMEDYYSDTNHSVMTRLLFVSNNSDQLQKDLESLISSNPETYGAETVVNNMEQNAKDERSIFLLISIFAYGLIVVIALIGITNIINTLGTSMELRARDFATLRSIGMTGKQFKRMVRLESFFTSVKSLFWGCLIGLGLSYLIWYFENTYDLAIIYHPPIKAVLISIAVVLVLVYAIISSSLSKINKRNIIETIKNENI